jgi:tetratricopeptide (TPR) repeat protein
MFFKKFFSKSYEQLLTKGDALFKEAHYAEARQYFHDALEKVHETAGEDQSRAYLHAMISNCGNSLAEMNIFEAEAAVRSANTQKAAEHLELALELTDDGAIKEKAETLLTSLTQFSSSNDTRVAPAGKNGCTSCSTCSPAHQDAPVSSSLVQDHLHSHEQFQLLINTLPGDLPQRYASLGEEFTETYLLAHAEENVKALNKFRQLLLTGDNDIILYEIAILEYKEGRVAVCEALLRKALHLVADNPVCNLSLAQLLADSGRLAEAAVLLKSMMARMILYEQSLIMLADVYTAQGDQENAITLLSNGIQMPTLKKASAERLVPILTAQGRNEEVKFIVKTYLKGCC